MDKKIKGAWLVHHTNKLQAVVNQAGYENTYFSGKAGILLSAISTNQGTTITDLKVKTLAQAANINITFELPKLLEILKKRDLIDTSSKGIAILGITTSSALLHTSDIFESLEPSPLERASLELAEQASIEPIRKREASENLSDTFHLAKSQIEQLISDSEQIGFVDTENLGDGESLLFNGNLFRRGEAKKIKAVLDSLSQTEEARLRELTDRLKNQACIHVDGAEKILGKDLFQKVTAIGLFDINIVSNSKENVGFITLPAAFSKFSSSSMVDDAFDLAKAFVSSITYGMTNSNHARGKIRMVEILLDALVRGESVGPVTAIGEDYKLLELKGVVQVTRGSKNGRVGPMLTLLKKEVGELALQAIKLGDVSEHSLASLPGGAVTHFLGPEANRERARKKQIQTSPKATNDMLSVLRTGGGFK